MRMGRLTAHILRRKTHLFVGLRCQLRTSPCLTIKAQKRWSAQSPRRPTTPCLWRQSDFRLWTTSTFSRSRVHFIRHSCLDASLRAHVSHGYTRSALQQYTAIAIAVLLRPSCSTDVSDNGLQSFRLQHPVAKDQRDVWIWSLSRDDLCDMCDTLFTSIGAKTSSSRQR